MKFSHLKNKKINMVDISSKEITSRIAEATNEIKFKKILLKKSLSLEVKKVKFSIQHDVLVFLLLKKHQN